MGKLFKNMLPYWKSVTVILCLLIVQAMCDLALPGYTSNIIDVGIINGGVEHVLPEKVEASTYFMLDLMMEGDEVEQFESSYMEEGDMYVLKDLSADELDTLDHELMIPMVIASQMKTYMSSDATDSQAMGQGQMDVDMMMQAVSSGAMSMDMIREMIAPYMAKGRASVEKMMETTGESTLKSMAVAYAKECEVAAGVDVDSKQIHYLIVAGGKMLAIALLMGIVLVFISLLASRVGAGIGRDLRKKVYENVIGFSNAEIDQFSTASLITRSTNDIQQIQMTTTLLLRMVFYAPIMGVGGVIKVMNTHSGMGWTIGLAVLTILGFVGTLMAVTMPKFKMMQNLVDRVNLVSREILTGLSVIRAFGREQREEERFDEANTNLMKTQLFTSRTMAAMMPGMMIVMNGVSILITWVAAHKIDMGTMQVGTMTAFITYAMQIVISFLMLTMMSILLPRAGVAADRIDEVVNTKSSVLDKEDAKRLDLTEGVVSYNHVNFRYPGGKADALSDINFTARPGEITAIIGSTGCGKSTLVNLLPRFYDVTEGSITIDGQDIRDVKMEDLRDGIGFVPQKGVLFSGTIASNLQFGKHDANEDEMNEAAAIAQATEFISEKKDGLHTSIAQGGTNVSGGQKQRLAIARALVKKPRILVFDDSFSALDMKTDAALRKALEDKVKDATVFIVAQRISTILHADQILVLDEGQIVGIGKHEDLLRNCEVYEQIARSQLSAKELGLEEKEA